MPSSRRFHILAVLVFAAGIAAALAAAGAGAWAWATPGTLVFFRIALPLLAVWMLVVLGRLALALRRRVGADRDDDWRDPLRTLLSQPRRVPDAAMRAVSPDAQFCQQIELPAEPEAAGWLRRRRRRIALHFGLPDGHHRFVVGPAPLVMARGSSPRRRSSSTLAPTHEESAR